jgi:hypothetical protein
MLRYILTFLLFGLVYNTNGQTHPILTKYLAIKDALINSDATKSSASVNELSISLKASPEFFHREDLIKQTEVMAKSGDLEKQRMAFADLSVTIWDAVKAQKWTSQELFYQYCPMKKSFWVGAESIVKNPYYGVKMLSCGSVKESF